MTVSKLSLKVLDELQVQTNSPKATKIDLAISLRAQCLQELQYQEQLYQQKLKALASENSQAQQLIVVHEKLLEILDGHLNHTNIKQLQEIYCFRDVSQWCLKYHTAYIKYTKSYKYAPYQPEYSANLKKLPFIRYKALVKSLERFYHLSQNFENSLPDFQFNDYSLRYMFIEITNNFKRSAEFASIQWNIIKDYLNNEKLYCDYFSLGYAMTRDITTLQKVKRCSVDLNKTLKRNYFEFEFSHSLDKITSKKMIELILLSDNEICDHSALHRSHTAKSLTKLDKIAAKQEYLVATQEEVLEEVLKTVVDEDQYEVTKHVRAISQFSMIPTDEVEQSYQGSLKLKFEEISGLAICAIDSNIGRNLLFPVIRKDDLYIKSMNKSTNEIVLNKGSVSIKISCLEDEQFNSWIPFFKHLFASSTNSGEFFQSHNKLKHNIPDALGISLSSSTSLSSIAPLNIVKQHQAFEKRVSTPELNSFLEQLEKQCNTPESDNDFQFEKMPRADSRASKISKSNKVNNLEALLKDDASDWVTTISDRSNSPKVVKSYYNPDAETKGNQRSISSISIDEFKYLKMPTSHSLGFKSLNDVQEEEEDLTKPSPSLSIGKAVTELKNEFIEFQKKDKPQPVLQKKKSSAFAGLKKLFSKKSKAPEPVKIVPQVKRQSVIASKKLVEAPKEASPQKRASMIKSSSNRSMVTKNSSRKSILKSASRDSVTKSGSRSSLKSSSLIKNGSRTSLTRSLRLELSQQQKLFDELMKFGGGATPQSVASSPIRPKDSPQLNIPNNYSFSTVEVNAKKPWSAEPSPVKSFGKISLKEIMSQDHVVSDDEDIPIPKDDYIRSIASQENLNAGLVSEPKAKPVEELKTKLSLSDFGKKFEPSFYTETKKTKKLKLSSKLSMRRKRSTDFEMVTKESLQEAKVKNAQSHENLPFQRSNSTKSTVVSEKSTAMNSSKETVTSETVRKDRNLKKLAIDTSVKTMNSLAGLESMSGKYMSNIENSVIIHKDSYNVSVWNSDRFVPVSDALLYLEVSLSNAHNVLCFYKAKKFNSSVSSIKPFLAIPVNSRATIQTVNNSDIHITARNQRLCISAIKPCSSSALAQALSQAMDLSQKDQSSLIKSRALVSNTSSNLSSVSSSQFSNIESVSSISAATCDMFPPPLPPLSARSNYSLPSPISETASDYLSSCSPISTSVDSVNAKFESLKFNEVSLVTVQKIRFHKKSSISGKWTPITVSKLYVHKVDNSSKRLIIKDYKTEKLIIDAIVETDTCERIGRTGISIVVQCKNGTSTINSPNYLLESKNHEDADELLTLLLSAN